VWDLGANVGLFSRIASERGIPTIACDIDPAAVELNYRECVRQSETNLLPLIIDLANPSPSLGWANEERSSLIERGPADVVFALALIHHLSISNNVPLADLTAFFSKIARWTIFEFVPKEDPQVQRLLISRDDIFDDYSLQGFEKAFADCFHIRRKEQIGGSSRTLYLMENRGN
jgi:ribosomal protein L11 methylase PrmA